MVVIHAQRSKDGKPAPLWSIGRHFSTEGTLGGQSVACQPIFAKSTYSSSWQGWRIAVGPSDVPRPIEMKVLVTLPGDYELTWGGHFVPDP